MMKSKDITRNDLLIIYSWLGIIGISLRTYVTLSQQVLMKIFLSQFCRCCRIKFDIGAKFSNESVNFVLQSQGKLNIS